MVETLKGAATSELAAYARDHPDWAARAAEGARQAREPGYWKFPAERDWTGVQKDLHAALHRVCASIGAQSPSRA
eukprot:6098861-Alexandrium_andersonii.AAC.1